MGLKAAVKATKRRLHQVFAAFDGSPDYERLFASLRSARASGSDAAIRASCRAALGGHASTRERLDELDGFYDAVFAVTGTPGSILDLACGLHPLAAPWMGLAPDVEYRAIDIDGRAVAFLDRCFPLLGVRGRAVHGDVLCHPPAEPADVAFVLKLLPTLDRQEPGGARRLLGALTARHVVVSYPVASLGGRDKGMREHYAQAFPSTARELGWEIERLEFATELVFVAARPADTV